MKKFMVIASIGAAVFASSMSEAAYYYCETCHDREISLTNYSRDSDLRGSYYYQPYRRNYYDREGTRRNYYKDSYFYQPYRWSDRDYYYYEPDYDSDYDSQNDYYRDGMRVNDQRGIRIPEHRSNVRGRGREQTRTDDWNHKLIRELQDTIEHDRYAGNYRNVNIHVNDGMITLTGTIDSQEDKQDLKNKIWKVEGVETIKDEITIRPNYQGEQDTRSDFRYTERSDRTEKSTDQELHTKVRDQLKGGIFSRGYPDVTFDVQNGHVTLRGAVDSVEDKRKLSDKIQDISGVKSVNNQVRVNETNR